MPGLELFEEFFVKALFSSSFSLKLAPFSEAYLANTSQEDKPRVRTRSLSAQAVRGNKIWSTANQETLKHFCSWRPSDHRTMQDPCDHAQLTHSREM